MIKFLPALIFVFVCVNIGSAQTRSNRVTAQEKKDLFQLIWKNDQDVAATLKDFGVSAVEAIKTMSVTKTDLNQDGQPEYIVELEEEHLCGALANCPDWVYRKSGNQYKLLLRTSGRELLIEKTVSGNYLDLRSEAGDTATQSYRTIYKYTGAKYQAKQCYVRRYAGKKDKLILIKCR